jgi:DNA ligase (NAD+)
MDIVGMGIKIVEQLVGANLVKDVADIYSLNSNMLLTLEGFAAKKADNLLASIESSKSRPLSRVINALGIRGVGEVMAVELAQHFNDLSILSRASLSDLQEIEGVGPNIALAITDWFKRETNRKVLEKLHQAGVWPTEQPAASKGKQNLPLSELVFVITGTIEGYTRDELKDLITQNGGKVTDSVSKNTSFVLVGEQPGSKLDKAKTLGVNIIDIEKFKQLLD